MTHGKVVGGALTLAALSALGLIFWQGGQAWGENESQTDDNTVEIRANDAEIAVIRAATATLQQAISEKAAVQAAEQRGQDEGRAAAIAELCARDELVGEVCDVQ